MVQILLAAGAAVDARQRGWKTPLMLAAAAGNAPVVRVLLDAGADAHARDEARQDALALAMARGHAEVGQLLRSAVAATPGDPQR
jgi:ankyrin repeat protein